MIKIETKHGIEYMSLKEFSRWACFAEAYHFIEQKAEELGRDYDGLIKPLAIEHYIKERYLSMLHDVTVEHELGNI